MIVPPLCVIYALLPSLKYSRQKRVKEVDVIGIKFGSNTSLLLIFCYGKSIWVLWGSSLQNSVKESRKQTTCSPQVYFWRAVWFYCSSVDSKQCLDSFRGCPFLEIQNSRKVLGSCSKIDINNSKAYVDWRYLFTILEEKGFKQKWIGSMRTCVTSVKVYLFILCTEILSVLLH